LTLVVKTRSGTYWSSFCCC